MNTCKNCSANFDSKFCPDCGTAAVVKRIDKHYLLHELQHVILHFEKGFFYTTKELFLRPGIAIKNFFEGNRSKHFKPIGYVIICSIIYGIISHNFEEKPQVLNKVHGNVSKIFVWITDHYNYSNLMEILFIAFILHLFFRKKGYNYFENIVLLSYLTGFSMFAGGFFILASYFANTPVFNTVFPFVMVLYCITGIAQFYNDKTVLTFIKSLLGYLSGFFLFVLAATMFGLLMDYLHL